MKFLFAVAIYILFVQIFFWTLIFLLGSPTVYKVEDIINASDEFISKENVSREVAWQEFQKGNDGETYIFAKNIRAKADSAFYLSALITFVSIFLGVIIFHKKSFVIFPIVTALVISFILYSSTWVFANSIPKTIYIDFLEIQESYPGILALKFLGIYIAIFCLLLVFGHWYRLHEK